MAIQFYMIILFIILLLLIMAAIKIYEFLDERFPNFVVCLAMFS